jgi:hypothetical protein
MFALAKIWKGTKAGGKWVWELLRRADVPPRAESIPVPDNRTAAEIIASNKVIKEKITERKLQQQLDDFDAVAPPPQQAAGGAAARTTEPAAARTTEPAAARTTDDAGDAARTADNTPPRTAAGDAAPPQSQADKLAAKNKALGEEITRVDLKRQLKEAKKAAKASGKAPILPARVINALTLGIVTPRIQKYILWGTGGWYLSSAGMDWAEKNPEKWATTFASLKKLFGGDLTDVDKISFPIKEIASSAGGSAVDDLSAAWKGAKDTIKGALSTDSAVNVTAKVPAAAKVTAKGNGGDDEVAAANTEALPSGHPPKRVTDALKEKPAPPKSKTSLKDDATSKTTYPVIKPKVVKKARKAPPANLQEKYEIAKSEHGKYSKEAGVAWGNLKGVDISYDPPGGTVKDYEEGLKAGTISKKLGISKGNKLTRAAKEDIEQLSMYRHGGSVSSDSYMLRKKPKTTSEVKKGSRQSRSWNY